MLDKNDGLWRRGGKVRRAMLLFSNCSRTTATLQSRS